MRQSLRPDQRPRFQPNSMANQHLDFETGKMCLSPFLMSPFLSTPITQIAASQFPISLGVLRSKNTAQIPQIDTGRRKFFQRLQKEALHATIEDLAPQRADQRDIGSPLQIGAVQGPN